MKTKIFVLSFCIFVLFPFIRYAEAECLRCRDGRELACKGDAKFDFISKCGYPDYSEKIAEQTRGSITGGTVVDGTIVGGSISATTKEIEVMYYNCGEGMFIESVKVKGGKVISITHGARGSGPVKCK